MTPAPLAFIGGGNMARSLIGGLLARGTPAASIRVAEPLADLRQALVQDFGVSVLDDNAEAARAAGVWVLAVKPQAMRAVCEALSTLAQDARPLVVSVAAGITATQLERWLGGAIAIVRCMPNTPALLGAGVSGLFANALVDDDSRALVELLMSSAGKTVWVDDEAQMDAVTAVSGSGPAYAFLLAEAMEAAACEQGLPQTAARALTLQTLLGASRMMDELQESPAQLRHRVTSPGGTTQAAIETLEAGGFRELVAAAIADATARGRALSAANDRPGEVT